MGTDGKKDIPGLGGGGMEQKEFVSPPDISGLLEELGIVADEATKSNIQKSIEDTSNHPSLARDIQIDAKVAKDNPTEKTRFELLYLKGLGQVVTLKDGSKVNMEDLWKREQGGENIIQQLASRSDKSAYDEYATQQRSTALNQEKKGLESEKTALNQTKDQRGEVKEALNQETERLNILSTEAKKVMDDEGLRFLSSELVKIQSNPESSPIIQNLVKQGAKMEDIQSGKYNGTIESHIIIANEEKLAPKDPEKAREFAQVVGQMRDSVGIPPTRENIDRFLGSKVLGEGREAVGTTMYQAGQSGKYEHMTWDPETREIVFHQRNGEKLIIDTTTIPPKKKLEDRGITISGSVVVTPETVARTKLEGEIQALESKYGEINTNIEKNDVFSSLQEKNSTQKENFNLIMKTLGGESPDISQANYANAWRQFNTTMHGGTTKQRIQSIQNLKSANKELERQFGIRSATLSLDKAYEGTFMSSNTPSPESTIQNSGLQEEYRGLDQLERDYKNLGEYENQLGAKKTELGKYISNNKDDSFDDIARSNLNWLTTNNFHKVGPRAQETLDRIVAELNKGRNDNNKIKLDEKELKQPEQDVLKSALEKLGGKRGVFEDADRLARFRLDIDKALALPADHPLSLESQINGTYERTYNNG